MSKPPPRLSVHVNFAGRVFHAGENIWNTGGVDYADDVVLFAHKMDDFHGAPEVFETTASQLGLHISWQKTKIQNLGAGQSTPCPPVCGHSLEEVTEFTYMGSV